MHAAECSWDKLLTGEKSDGFASIILTRCTQCDNSIQLLTSRKVMGPKGYSRWEWNLAAFWGQISSGGGHSKLQETMGLLGVPVMHARHFINAERDIGEWWQKQLEEVMTEAGKEEKRSAEEKGDYHQGVPAITVIVDGGWSKHSHRHF